MFSCACVYLADCSMASSQSSFQSGLAPATILPSRSHGFGKSGPIRVDAEIGYDAVRGRLCSLCCCLAIGDGFIAQGFPVQLKILIGADLIVIIYQRGCSIPG